MLSFLSFFSPTSRKKFPRKPVSFVAGVLSGSHWSAGNREHKGWRAGFKWGVGGCFGGVVEVGTSSAWESFPVSVLLCRNLKVRTPWLKLMYHWGRSNKGSRVFRKSAEARLEKKKRMWSCGEVRGEGRAVIDTEAAAQKECCREVFPLECFRSLVIMQESHFGCLRLSEHELRVSRPACCDWKWLFTPFVASLSRAEWRRRSVYLQAELVFIVTCAAQCVPGGLLAWRFFFLQAWIQSGSH